MNRSATKSIACLVLLLTCLSLSAATPQEVERAIDKAKEWLYSEQKDGTWEKFPAPQPPGKTAEGIAITGADSHQWGGVTALATYALLATGENHQEPRLKPAIAFLKKHTEIQGIYAVGIRCQVWGYLPFNAETKQYIQRDAAFLLNAMKTGTPGKTNEACIGMYNYTADGPGGRFDHSVSQYGVLGMWACAEADLEIPIKYWETVDAAWRAQQAPEGNWFYVDKPTPWAHPGSMTAAGVATLFITQDYLRSADAGKCLGNLVDPNIDKGLKWISDNFPEVLNGINNYTAYGIERIGMASGYKYFSSVDWYQQIADNLIHRQAPAGNWGNVSDTAFAMIFLERGRAPVVMNKLQYTIDTAGDKKMDAHWNERPRDVAHLTRWMGRQMERWLNWQIVNLDAPIDDLHDAPILYISGNQALNFSVKNLAKIKQFVEEGGLILGNADCNAVAFTASFKKLGEKIYPFGEFRNLPPDHPIFTRQQYLKTKWRNPMNIMGLSNGCRELMILIPAGDPAKAWQMRTLGGHEEQYQFAADLFQYTVDRKNMQYKGQTHVVRAIAGKIPTQGVHLAVGSSRVDLQACKLEYSIVSPK